MTDSRKTRILLAEDSEDHARILTVLLERAGFELIRARDGVEAYEWILANPAPDLLITDVMMPGMSGFELLTRLKAEGRMPPSIVLTGKQTEEDTLRGLETGALDYISKPFSPSIVLARIKRALERLDLAA